MIKRSISEQFHAIFNIFCYSHKLNSKSVSIINISLYFMDIAIINWDNRIGINKQAISNYYWYNKHYNGKYIRFNYVKYEFIMFNLIQLELFLWQYI